MNSLEQFYDNFPQLAFGDLQSINMYKPWHAGDSVKLYNKNIKDRNAVEKLKQYGWFEVPIAYNFNKQGFRSHYNYNESSNAKVCAAFGCSNTLGEAVQEHHAWPSVLAKKVSARIYNFGVSGSSADTNYRHALYWLPKIKPESVYWLMPNMERIEMVQNPKERALYITPNEKHGYDKFYDDWAITDFNMLIHQHKIISAMEQLCSSLEINLYILLRRNFKHHDWGRDLRHPGIDTHASIANMFYSLSTGQSLTNKASGSIIKKI